MAEIKFAKVPLIVGKLASSGIEIGPGMVRMVVEHEGERLELAMPAAEASEMGCGFIVAAHAAKGLASQQVIRPIAKGVQ